MKNFSAIRMTALILLAGMSLGACHTMQGAGEDTSDAGHAVERAAQ